MSIPAESVRPAKLWKGLTDEQRFAAAAAFWADEQAVAEQAEVVGTLARQINFRPKSVMALPAERRAKLLARMGQVSDLVAARLLVSYHLAHQRPMMKAFLDALGIKHEEGLLDENMEAPGRERLLAAGRQLMQEYPPADVSLYFRTLLLQDPGTWGELQELADSEREG